MSNSAKESTSAYIERIVNAAPPLSPDQRDRLAALLGGVGA